LIRLLPAAILVALSACTTTETPTAPEIALQVSAVTFTATVGGPNPGTQVVTVRNGGIGRLSALAVGTITYAVSQPTGWLSASLSDTTDPANLTLSATTGALTPGTYTARVYITANGAENSPQTIDVTFRVNALPAIQLSQSSVAFYAVAGGSNPSGQDVDVSNGGDGTLTGLALGAITYGSGQPTGWLGATLDAATGRITLFSNASTLPTGSDTATIPVLATNATNSPQSLTVALTVSPSTFSMVSSGWWNTCALTQTGAPFCWGKATGLGNGMTSPSLVPVAVAGGLTFTTLSAGGSFACGLTTAGAAYCWSGASPVAVSGGLTFTSIGVGYYWACGVAVGGAAYCWQYNTPAPVPGGLTFTSISAGYSHSCALTPTGQAYCWGDNVSGQLGNNSTTGSDVPVAVVGGLTFQSLSTGVYNTCGVTTTGAAYCWGQAPVGDGTDVSRLAPVPVAGGLTFASISAGFNICGVTTAGAGYCWGMNSSGEIGDGTTIARNRPTPVSGGLTFATISESSMLNASRSCGITPAGALYCWGANYYGELGNGTTVTSLVPVRTQ